MVFTKYIFFLLSFSSVGLAACLPDIISVFFDHTQNNECRSLSFSSKEIRSVQGEFSLRVGRMHMSLVTSSLVTDPSKFLQLANIQINKQHKK